VVGVRIRPGVGAPPVLRVLRDPDPAVPDDVHDAEAPGVAVLLAARVLLEQPVQKRRCPGHVRAVVGRHRPVPGPALLVLAASADGAAAGEAAAAGGRIGAPHEPGKGDQPWLRRRVARDLRNVRRQLLDLLLQRDRGGRNGHLGGGGAGNRHREGQRARGNGGGDQAWSTRTGVGPHMSGYSFSIRRTESRRQGRAALSPNSHGTGWVRGVRATPARPYAAPPVGTARSRPCHGDARRCGTRPRDRCLADGG
jgi:hypothetical protein